jgi:hypothetical protein
MLATLPWRYSRKWTLQLFVLTCHIGIVFFYARYPQGIWISFCFCKISYRQDREEGLNVKLKNKVVLVTGASQGIGRGIARGLAEAGAAVVVNCDRNIDAAKAVASEIQAL